MEFLYHIEHLRKGSFDVVLNHRVLLLTLCQLQGFVSRQARTLLRMTAEFERPAEVPCITTKG